MAKTKFMTSEQIDAQIAELTKLRAEQPKKIVAFVTALGNTDRKIAASLRKLGIKAVQGSSSKCALAVALRKEFGIDEVSVRSADTILVDGFEVKAEKNNKAVATFIVKFDDGKYPSLVK